MFTKFLNENRALIIAEVGQNHQGQLDIAREYIHTFAFHGADVIKFQVRNNKYLFSAEAYGANYDTENSFGKTYGEHRETLELNPEWLPILKKDCEDHGVLFMVTPFDEPSLDLLQSIGVDIIKLASFDLGNLPFINKIGSMGKPVVMSVGGGGDIEIERSVRELQDFDIECAILHCVSEYPCSHDRLGLNRIKDLIQMFPNHYIGLSDHFNGILSGPIAYLMGARIFEKHVTLNRSWKGTDHSFALEPDGFRRFARDIRRVDEMLTPKSSSDLGKEPVFKKLGKSIVAGRDLSEGEVLTRDNISGKILSSPVIPVRESMGLLGRKINRFIKLGEPINYFDIQN